MNFYLKTTLLWIFLAFFMALCMIGGASAVECNADLFDGNGSSCAMTSSLTINGTYNINANGSSSGVINVNANNIILDCNGTRLIGNGSVGLVGIYTSRVNVTIKNCVLNNYNYGIQLQGGGSQNNTVLNNTLNNSIKFGIYIRSGYGNHILNNTLTYGNQSNELINQGSDIYLSGADNSVCEYNNIDFGHYRGIEVDDTGINNIIRYNIINQSYQNGIEVVKSSNNSIIYNNTIINCGHNGINLRSFNNTVYLNFINLAYHHGIDFYSCGGTNDIGSGNNFVYNNTIQNMIESHFLYFCNSSYNRIENNIFFNASINESQYGIVFGDKSNWNNFSSNIINLTSQAYIFISDSINNTFTENSFYATKGNWIQFKNSFYNSLNLINNNNLFNLNFIQFNGIYNHTNYFEYFVNTNDTIISIFNIYNLSSALFYNSTNSICSGSSSNIANNDGNINITLQPNEACYVLDNFNLTEGVSREKSPISFTASTDNYKVITSNLTDSVNITVMFNVSSCNRLAVRSTTQSFYPGDYTCENNQTTINLVYIQPGVNNLNLEYNYVEFIEPLNLRSILIDGLAGSTRIFLFIMMIAIASLAGYFRMPNIISLVLFGLFMVFMSQLNLGLFVLAVLAFGMIITYSFGRIIKG